MIKETKDIELINSFLDKFNVEINENPYRKYISYDNKALLVYSKIYERLEIDYIYVQEEYRNQKIATKLLNYLFSLYDYTCSLEVRCDNINAINLYKKFNFEIVSIREKYYGDIDAYLMVRK